MSLLEKYLAGWRFRTTRPELEPGSRVDVFLSEYDPDEDAGVARIGDTRLYVDGARPEHVERRVRVEVDEFDTDDSTGRGRFVEVVGESSYTG